MVRKQRFTCHSPLLALPSEPSLWKSGFHKTSPQRQEGWRTTASEDSRKIPAGRKSLNQDKEREARNGFRTVHLPTRDAEWNRVWEQARQLSRQVEGEDTDQCHGLTPGHKKLRKPYPVGSEQGLLKINL